MLELLYATNLKPLFGIRHGFFTRVGGVSQGIYEGLNCGLSSDDAPQAVEENRRLAAVQFEAKPENLLSCSQIHSPDVVTVKLPWFAAGRPRADAMVTRERGLMLGVLTADCAPVLLADERIGVIGAAHAGWRGALAGVLENTIKAMEDLGAQRQNIQAALGPCIGWNSYEVGPEFLAPFLAENADNQKFFRPSPRAGHYQFNLPGYVMAKLNKIGIAPVEPPPADTLSDEARFFSYRRNCLKGETKVGSLMSAIMLIDPHRDDKDKTLQELDDEKSGMRNQRYDIDIWDI